MTERDQDRGDGRDPIDEEAAWAEIVAGYGEEPADPPGVWPAGDQIDLTDTVDRVKAADAQADGPGTAGGAVDARDAGAQQEADPLAKGGAAPASGAGSGPRDWEAAEDEDEGHFVPPEPPPLPQTDLATKLAWLGVLGGPLLLIAAMVFRWEMTWWMAVLGIGGFLGGLTALVLRMQDDPDDDWTTPGSGAVV